MIIQIVNPFDTTEKYSSLYSINQYSKGITELKLTYNINQPNELECVFNTNLQPGAYYALKDGDFGLRIKKDGHDLLFIQDKSSKKVDSIGQVSVRFYSGIYKAFYSEPKIINQQYINKSGIETANLIEGFEFALISNDVKLSLTAGANNNLDIINELRQSSGSWSYFDAGLSPKGDGTFTNKILLGLFDEIENYSGVDSRFATETLKSRNIQNIFSDEPVLVNLTSFSNGRQIKFLYPVLETGAGAGTNNSIKVFTRTNYDFVNPKFPLVEINGKIYIQDTTYKGLEQRFFVYPVTSTANSDNGAQSQFLNDNDALSYLYRKAIYYLKTQQESLRIDCEMAFKKLTFPKFLKVKYNKTIRKGNQKYVIHDIDEKILFTKLQFDLTKL